MHAANFGVHELNATEAREINGGADPITGAVVAMAALFIAAFGSGFKSGYEAGSQR